MRERSYVAKKRLTSRKGTQTKRNFRECQVKICGDIHIQAQSSFCDKLEFDLNK